MTPWTPRTSAAPDLTSLVASRMDALGLLRRAWAGCSSSPILPAEGTNVTGWSVRSYLASSISRGPWSPTNRSSTTWVCNAWMAPFTVSSGPKSPPMASTATRTGRVTRIPSTTSLIFGPLVIGLSPCSALPQLSPPTAKGQAAHCLFPDNTELLRQSTICGFRDFTDTEASPLINSRPALGSITWTEHFTSCPSSWGTFSLIWHRVAIRPPR